MKLGIISDTHDDNESLSSATKIFKDKKVDLVFHLGDYIGPGALRFFEGLKLIGIFGNNDGDRLTLVKKANLINAELKGDFYETELDGVKIALYHGTYPAITDALMNCGKYDFLFTGHVHKKVDEKVGKTRVINPGTAHRGMAKEMKYNPSVLIFDTSSKNINSINL